MLIMKIGKGETTIGIQLPNQESMRTLGEKKNYNWKYWKYGKWMASNRFKKNLKRVPQMYK